MLDTPAHAFAPPQAGYPELASERLARDISRFNDSASARAQANQSRLFIIMAAVALILVFIFAASVGLARTEQQYQSARRV